MGGIVALSFVTAINSNAAPTIWTVGSGGNGHSYEVFAVPGGVTWQNARTAAQAKGGDLATLTSAAENAFVFALADNAIYWNNPNGLDSAGPWIGGIQPPGSAEPAGGWSWVTGEPFVFTNWSSNSPNNNTTLGNEDRIELYAQGPTNASRSGQWNDAANLDTHIIAYVVEYVPEPITLPVMGGALLGLSRRRRAQ